MRPRLPIVLAITGLLAASAPARAEQPFGAPLDTDADLTAASWFEDRILDHFHYGQIHEQYYVDSERAEGEILTLVGENDSALYTGNYLAAEAFRYALAAQKLAAGEDASFWEAQKAQAKSRVDQMVEQFHLLINISAAWQTEFDPRVNDDREPTDDGYIDFGGGVFPGEAGLLFRACTPVDAPPPLNVGRDPGRDRLVGPLDWEDGEQYYCLDATSRDAYAGVTFGLATAFDLVTADDPAMRETIRHDLMAMTDYALKYLWNTPRPHGEIVVPELFGGNDLDNFVSPLFVYVPMARLNMLQVARHAAREAGTAEHVARYEALWAEELASQVPVLAASMEIDAAGPHGGYYKYHLHHITGFNLVRLEQDPVLREVFAQAFGVMDATTGDDVNALFEAITFALTGEEPRLDDAVEHHRQWLDYRANADANGNVVNNSAACGTTLTCVPRDQVDMVQPLPEGEDLIVSQPGFDDRQRAQDPLPVALRYPADFMWQKDPTILDGGPNDPRWESPGADFLLPYWMIRYYTEAAPPALSPFPAWPGPIFR